jgi:hypothetical protein
MKEGKRPLGRPRRRWENMKKDLRGMGWDGVDWIHLAQKRPVAGSCEYGNEPFGSIKGKEFLEYLSVLLASQGLCSIELAG